MKFGSWTYDGSQIDLQLQGEGGDTSSFIPNGEWELIGERSCQYAIPYNTLDGTPCLSGTFKT